MLVDRRAGQEAEASLVTFAHHDRVYDRAAAHEVFALDRRAGRAAADRAAAREHGMKLIVCGRSFVGVDEAPLPAAAEPHAAALA